MLVSSKPALVFSFQLSQLWGFSDETAGGAGRGRRGGSREKVPVPSSPRHAPGQPWAALQSLPSSPAASPLLRNPKSEDRKTPATHKLQPLALSFPSPEITAARLDVVLKDILLVNYSSPAPADAGCIRQEIRPAQEDHNPVLGNRFSLSTCDHIPT